MKIYMASSWKMIDKVRELAQLLRDNGHEVDDFTDSSRGRYVFFFKDLPGYEDLNAITLLDHEPAVKAFVEDKKYIDWSEVVFLLLPSGKSAHLEAGYAVGSGKKLIIFQESYPFGEFDVMYGFADLITSDMKEALKFLSAIDERKVFKCNDDGVAEWCIAMDKQQAYEFMLKMWGESTMGEYIEEYYEDNPGSSLDEFIECFFTEMPADQDFCIKDAGESGGPLTRKISEWAISAVAVPFYLCCEDW